MADRGEQACDYGEQQQHRHGCDARAGQQREQRNRQDQQQAGREHDAAACGGRGEASEQCGERAEAAKAGQLGPRRGMQSGCGQHHRQGRLAAGDRCVAHRWGLVQGKALTQSGGGERVAQHLAVRCAGRGCGVGGSHVGRLTPGFRICHSGKRCADRSCRRRR